MELKSTTKPHVAVVGTSWMELSIDVPWFPTPGETLYSGPANGGPGGHAPTIASILAALECRVFLLSCVGMDSHGSQVLSDVRRRGINVDYVERIENAATSVIHTLRDPGGNTARMIAGIAGPAMTKTPLLAAKAMISSCQAMALLPDIPEETFTFAIDVAHYFHVPVIAYAAPAENFPVQSLGKIDLLIVNAEGTRKLTGVFPNTIGRADEALNHLISKGASAAIIYLDGAGAAASSALRATRFFPPRKNNRSPAATEAEDAFVAAVVFQMMLGAPIHEAATFALANAAATAARSSPGRFPSPREVSNYLAMET